jgi:hypothetical protein
MSNALTLEVVTDSQVTTAELQTLADSIAQSFDLILKFEDSFDDATLEHRLEIGLNIARAQEKFTLSNTDKTAAARDAKALLSTVDNRIAPTTSPGFNSWLNTHVDKRLKRTTATRYASAFRALGLPLTATPRDITARIKTLRHDAGKAGKPMPKISDLLKIAPKPPKPEALVIQAPKDSPQQRLEDAREGCHVWAETFYTMVKRGVLDDLDKQGLETLKEFLATARDRVNARLK